MGLTFRYKLEPVAHPILSLGGRWVRPRPIVAVTLIGPADSRPHDALLDTGGDETIFPDKLASKIGIDLANAPAGQIHRIGAAVIDVRYAEVTLRLADNNERREWNAWIAFARQKLPYSVLGFAGCLQFFTSTFHGDREEVTLEVNSLYPGR
jgi:hypothetical protein